MEGTEEGSWNKIALTQDELRVLYREWGVFYTHKQKLDVAAKYYDISLGIKSDESKALYNRSRCKRNIAETKKALYDATAAAEIDPLSQPYNLEVCDTLYQLNRFEETKCSLINRSRRFHGLKLKGFLDREEVVGIDFKATLGTSLCYHILENEKYFVKASEKQKSDLFVDSRPRWKILRDNKECDVSSIPEEKEELLSPIERARRKLGLTKFMQLYLGRSWEDIFFLKAMRNHPHLLLPQSYWSTPLMEDITNKKYSSALLFLKMLHTRSPLYTQKRKQFKSQTFNKYNREVHLNRIQNQTHRNMINILRTTTNMRKQGTIQKLSNYIEEVMGDYVVLKTTRVMPWKFEFITEIYNMLALAHIDTYFELHKKEGFLGANGKERFAMLLKISKEKFKELPKFVFGERSTFLDEDMDDLQIIKHRKLVSRMEQRLIFAEHSIEKSYLYHEIARSLFKNSLFDQCFNVARKGVQEAQNCNSLVWNLLNLLLICKTHTILFKVDQITETLADIRVVANLLNDNRVHYYVRLLETSHTEAEVEKKLQDNERRAKSIYSIRHLSSNGSDRDLFKELP